MVNAFEALPPIRDELSVGRARTWSRLAGPANGTIGKRVMDYLKKIDELRDAMKRKAEETDRRFNVSSHLDQAARTAGEALRTGTDVAMSGIDAARKAAGQIHIDPRISSQAKEAASAASDAAKAAAVEASDVARNVTASLRTGANFAKDQASDFFGDARQYYEAASSAASAGASAATVAASLVGAVNSAKVWVKENPGKATVVTLSLIAGVRAGAAWPGLDVVILGAGSSGHWLFHSAVASYGMYKLSDKYMGYLKERERMLAEGRLTEAERSRVEFQRNAAKYVGAPLLGAFSVAAGAALIAEAFTGGTVIGFPVNLILGGNPLLSSIWLFGNGVVCFHNGYKFFMMALAKEEDVQRVVHELKGLLPAAVTG